MRFLHFWKDRILLIWHGILKGWFYRNVTDRSGEYRDTFEGNFELAPGISGQGIILDTDGTETIIIWLRQESYEQVQYNIRLMAEK
ncbi:MAG: hypothetical protein AMS26_24225 [Bacteroides sp. SM23_62]|nr:MAG: hypothetical protein AMS26_24225 [Bacteroides sp. SM23_62]